MALDLENTEIAFRSQTDAELRRSLWLFRMMAHPSLVSVGTKMVGGFLKLHFPIEWLVKQTIFRQFCGGETIEDCRPTIDRLARYGVGTILDYSVEGAGTEEAFEATTQELLRTVDFAAGNPDIPFCVFKISGFARFTLLEKVSGGEKLGEDEREEWERVRSRLISICARAYQKKVQVFVDAEESWIQDAIDHLAEEMMAQYNRDVALVFTTVQMYRHDRLAYLRGLVGKARAAGFFVGVKLVRGAYMEKERARAHLTKKTSPICADKAATDRNYDAGLLYCLENRDRISFCVATHNEASCRSVVDAANRDSLRHDDPHLSFAQLLGMSDNLSYNLADSGFRVAKYVPYGPVKAVMPYLFRRAEENTSIQGQTSRELALLAREVERRGLAPVGSTPEKI